MIPPIPGLFLQPAQPVLTPRNAALWISDPLSLSRQALTCCPYANLVWPFKDGGNFCGQALSGSVKIYFLMRRSRELGEKAWEKQQSCWECLWEKKKKKNPFLHPSLLVRNMVGAPQAERVNSYFPFSCHRKKK